MKPALWFLVGLFLLRLAFLLATLDPAEERIAEVLDPAGLNVAGSPERPLFDREELYTGTAAAAIGQGLGIPLEKYQFMKYGGGSLVTSLLATPLYSLFGSTYLVFKTLPMLVTLGAGLFWFLITSSWLGGRAALLFGFLFLFAPSNFVRTMLIAKGDHAEAAMWIGLVFLFATRAFLAASDARKAAVWSTATGILAGFGIFLTYSTVPITLSVFGVGLLTSRFQHPRLWLLGLAGFTLGLLPWITGAVRSGGEAFRVYGQTVGSSESGAAIGGRLSDLLNSGLYAGYDLPLEGLGPIAALVFLIAVIFGVVRLTVDGRRREALFPRFLLAGVLAHLVAFVVAAPDNTSRYMIPGYPLLLLAIVYASGLGRREPSKISTSRLGRQSRFLTLAVLTLGIAASITSLTSGSFRALGPPLSGTDWPLLGEIVGQKLPPETIEGFPAETGRHFWIGFGKQVYAQIEPDHWIDSINQLPELDRASVWKGVGIAWTEGGGVLDAGTYLDTAPASVREPILSGIEHYAELVFAPLAVDPRNLDLARAQVRIAGEHASRLNRFRARTVAILEVGGIEIGSGAWTGIDRDTRRSALSEAIYSGMKRTGIRLRASSPEIEADLGLSIEAIAGGSGDASIWIGISRGLLRDLRTTDPSWLVGDAGRPNALLEWLARTCENMSDEAAGFFYNAAGLAVGEARSSIQVTSEDRSPHYESELIGRIPAPRRAAFTRGLSGLID